MGAGNECSAELARAAHNAAWGLTHQLDVTGESYLSGDDTHSGPLVSLGALRYTGPDCPRFARLPLGGGAPWPLAIRPPQMWHFWRAGGMRHSVTVRKIRQAIDFSRKNRVNCDILPRGLLSYFVAFVSGVLCLGADR